MHTLYNEPCIICGSSKNYLIEHDERKTLFCENCNYLEDIYVSDELKQRWIEEARAKEQARINAEIQAQLNAPRCPTCSSTNLKKISATSKLVNTALFGVLGTKRHKTFHCNNCEYEW